VLALRLLLALRPETGFVPQPRSGPDDRPGDERINDTLDFIHTNYKKRLTLRSLAARISMHPVYFSRKFKRVTGMSPHQYVLAEKIRKAKDFLILGGESLTTTAQELGFHDYSHFYRAFRRVEGISPQKFLKRSGRGR
jgi:AraC family transcriptional regulator